MVLVSKAVATDESGQLLKGFYSIKARNDRIMYYTDDKANKEAVKQTKKAVKKKSDEPIDKPVKKGKKTIEESTVVEFE